MKKFIIKIITVAVVIALLYQYNVVTAEHVEADAEAKAEYDAAMAEIEKIGTWEDGVWEGTAMGFGGDVVVDVTIEDAAITGVEIVSAEFEDSEYLEMAMSILDDIVDAQSADVDTVTGATLSSEGIIGAAEAALDEAVIR